MTGVQTCDVMFFFFKQKTAYEIKECDWSSDVCSSDLSTPQYNRSSSQQKISILRAHAQKESHIKYFHIILAPSPYDPHFLISVLEEKSSLAHKHIAQKLFA